MKKRIAITQDIMDTICERIADGKSLRAICKGKGMPAYSTVLHALAKEENQAWRQQYAHAREDQADTLADEIVAIADKHPGKTELGKDAAGVAHLRLRVDARKWVASKLKPKKYGDKQEIEHSGNLAMTLESIVSGASKPEAEVKP